MAYQNTEFKNFKETPSFIKAFLDSISNGKFLIAEQEEKWNGGCVQSNDEPSRKFVSAVINNNKFEMNYWQGGFVTLQKHLEINFKGKNVLSYSIHDLPPE